MERSWQKFKAKSFEMEVVHGVTHCKILFQGSAGQGLPHDAWSRIGIGSCWVNLVKIRIKWTSGIWTPVSTPSLNHCTLHKSPLNSCKLCLTYLLSVSMFAPLILPKVPSSTHVGQNVCSFFLKDPVVFHHESHLILPIYTSSHIFSLFSPP